MLAGGWCRPNIGLVIARSARINIVFCVPVTYYGSIKAINNNSILLKEFLTFHEISKMEKTFKSFLYN